MHSNQGAAQSQVRFDPTWLDGLSVYQDVVLADQVAVPGVRDCQARWQHIAPHLPGPGTYLDIGSNFGWFGLQIARTWPASVVASLEADERSARVQRAVLASHDHHRIALLTRPASPRLLQRWAQFGQHFDAALLLSVLHWIPQPHKFLQILGQLARSIIIEYPDPRETGAGSDRIRRQIGPLAPFLTSCFPTRPILCIGETASHRDSDHPRQLWWIGPEPHPSHQRRTPRLAFPALRAGHLSWPSRDWWQNQAQRQNPTLLAQQQSWFLTPQGLSMEPAKQGTSVARLTRQLTRLPQNSLNSRHQRLLRLIDRATDRLSRIGR
jgi:SAM-dependent methyltransferase